MLTRLAPVVVGSERRRERRSSPQGSGSGSGRIENTPACSPSLLAAALARSTHCKTYSIVGRYSLKFPYSPKYIRTCYVNKKQYTYHYRTIKMYNIYLFLFLPLSRAKKLVNFQSDVFCISN